MILGTAYIRHDELHSRYRFVGIGFLGTLLVYDRTESPLVTATVYAMSFLPWVAGGPVLAGLADRYPRRTVMVICDVGRALLVGLMLLPGMPILALCVLLFCAELLASPF